MIKTSGVHHISLTVRDIAKSKEFYTKVCGMKIIVAEKEYAGLTDGTFSLWLILPENEIESAKFNPNNPGLHHWAFTADSMEELKQIESHLKSLGVEMEDGGITDDGYGGTGIFTKDPDGMKVEFHLK